MSEQAPDTDPLWVVWTRPQGRRFGGWVKAPIAPVRGRVAAMKAASEYELGVREPLEVNIVEEGQFPQDGGPGGLTYRHRMTRPQQ